MDTSTQTASSVKGRKDHGQEAVPKPDVLRAKLKELVHLHNKKTAASDAFNDAVKKAAEGSGLLASVIAAVAAAEANDKFEDAKKKANQLSLAFDECAE